MLRVGINGNVTVLLCPASNSEKCRPNKPHIYRGATAISKITRAASKNGAARPHLKESMPKKASKKRIVCPKDIRPRRALAQKQQLHPYELHRADCGRRPACEHRNATEYSTAASCLGGAKGHRYHYKIRDRAPLDGELPAYWPSTSMTSSGFLPAAPPGGGGAPPSGAGAPPVFA